MRRFLLLVGMIVGFMVVLAACSESGTSEGQPKADADFEPEENSLDGDADGQESAAEKDNDISESADQAEIENEIPNEAEPELPEIEEAAPELEPDPVQEMDATEHLSQETEELEPEEVYEGLNLAEVTPRHGFVGRTVQITLRGQGFAPGMTVEVGGVFAAEVQVLSSTEAKALLSPVLVEQRGPKTVRIAKEGFESQIEHGFAWLYERDPIVFVHGYGGTVKDFEVMIPRFRDMGYPDDYLNGINFKDNMGSNYQNAEELSAFVAHVLEVTGAPKVDMIVHSMGGMSSRYYIGFMNGGDKIRDYVSLSSPHHGNDLACVATFTGEGAKEMCPAYSTDTKSLQWKLNGGPNDTTVDETPFGVEDGGGIYWNAFHTDADFIVRPPEVGCLNQSKPDDCTDMLNVKIKGVQHNDMPKDAAVFEQVKERVMRHDLYNP